MEPTNRSHLPDLELPVPSRGRKLSVVWEQLDRWTVLTPSMPLGARLQHYPGVTYLAMVVGADSTLEANIGAWSRAELRTLSQRVDRVLFYEPPSLCAAVVATAAMQLLDQRPTLIIATDVHLSKGSPDRFKIDLRAARLAYNLDRIRSAFPDADVEVLGESYGALVAAYAHILAGAKTDRVSLISPPFSPEFPESLQILLGVRNLNHWLPIFVSQPFPQRVQKLFFRNMVAHLGTVVDACYPPSERPRFRSYWHDALEAAFIRPAELALEARAMQEATQQALAAVFYKDLHELVASDPAVRVLVDPDDALLRHQRSWLSFPSVTGISGIGHSPLHLDPLPEGVRRWLLANLERGRRQVHSGRRRGRAAG